VTEYWHRVRPVAVPDERIGRFTFSRRGAALGASLSALAGFVSWCAVTGANLLVFPQDQMFSKQLHAAAASYDRQTP
jgi:hypothetical protein